MVRAAVVGGGIFGATAAVELARAGVRVDLYERHPNLLLGASRANQARLHAGYHYPRSPKTAIAAKLAGPLFAARFPEAVRTDARHYYLVARDGLVTAAQYLGFCDRVGLGYTTIAHHPLVSGASVEVALLADEMFIDIPALRHALRRDLLGAGVALRLGAAADPEGLIHAYDWVVDATYGRHTRRPLRFEVCEVALVRLGQHFADTSFVVMDGPFMSLDPLRGTGLHLLYDVAHSVHHANVGLAAEIPGVYQPFIDRGVLYAPMTRVAAMEQTARRFLCGIGMPEYRGSMFTVRAVLPDVDATDERPTLVDRDGNLITVLAGKIGTAVAAARRVVDYVQERHDTPGLGHHADVAAL